jgi:hypothetical protein
MNLFIWITSCGRQVADESPHPAQMPSYRTLAQEGFALNLAPKTFNMNPEIINLNPETRN